MTNLLLINLMFVLLFGPSGFCQVGRLEAGREAHSDEAGRVLRFRIERAGALPGALFIFRDGAETRIADDALNAWILANGHEVAYSSPDGAGGYENEGQALRLYDSRAGKATKILSEYFLIENVHEARATNGQRALLVAMRDGGLGASHLAVVDPHRGEVFVKQKVRLVTERGGTVVVAYYRDEDWETLARGQPVSPYRKQSYSLRKLLKHEVIVNKKVP
jgi:hypothetical protein